MSFEQLQFLTFVCFVASVSSVVISLFQGDENTEAWQLTRWGFMISVCTLLGFLIALAIKYVAIETNPKTDFLFIGVGLGGTLWGLSAWLVFEVEANMVYLFNDVFFGSKGNSGIKIYIKFFGGLKCRFPWELRAGEINLDRDISVPFKFDSECEGYVLVVSGSFTLKPDPCRIQQVAETSLKEEDRNRLWETEAKNAVIALASDVLYPENGEDIMRNKRMFSRLINEQANFTEAASHGFLVNNIKIGNVDMSDEQKKAFEQIGVTENIRRAAKIHLDAQGINDPSPEEYNKAFQKVLVTADEANLQIIDIQGLDGTGKGLDALGKAGEALIKKLTEK